MKKLALLFVFAIGFAISAMSQEKNPFWDRILIGGNFGASFGSSYTYVELSPTASYMFTERFSAGAGLIYQYMNRDFEFVSGTTLEQKNLSSNVYGGKLLGRYNITDQVFALSELELVSNQYYQDLNTKKREWSMGTFFGGGFSQPLGNKGNVYIAAMYNFSYDEKTSPYNEPYVLRVGFNL